MLVMIKWRDACDFKGSKADYDKRLPLVVTYGTLVHQDSEKILVQYHAGIEEQNALQVDNDEESVAIPIRWIEEAWCVRNPKWRRMRV